MLVSLMKNYVNHLAAQTIYRFDESSTFANKPKQSSLSSRTEPLIAAGHCEAAGAASAPEVSFEDRLFSHIIDAWVVRSPFETVFNKYVKAELAKGIPRVDALVRIH
jgi:hypothetical protein